MRILLADDSVTAQNMGKKILTEAGHEVVCVSNGAAALKKVSEQEPELVILDIYMPGYGGLEVCQRLKENPGTAGLPVVLTVGKLEPFRKEDAQRVRAEALIVKPFEASELQAAVARFAEIAASAPAKPKKSKGGPPPKAEPQPSSEDDYVTTSQREAQKEPETVSATGAGAHEFAVTPAASEPDVPESQWGSVTPAEFSVQGQETNVSEVGTKAAAAAAGADFSSAGEVAPAGAVEPAASFATAEAPAAHSSGFSPQVAEEAAAGAAPGFAVEAPMVPPAVDPAFDPDRTQWVTQFATRFGVEEEAPAEAPAPEASEEAQPEITEEAQPEATEEAQASEQPASEEAQAQTVSAPNEEIAAILSTLPGGMGGSAEAEPSPAGEQVRPWPLDATTPGEEQWKAEEVPVEDRDSSVSLAEEMEKAFVAAQAAPSSFAEEPAPEPQAAAFEPPPDMPVQASEAVPAAWEAPAQEAPAAAFEAPLQSHEAVPGAAEENISSAAEVAEAPPVSAAPASEMKAEPDRVAGVMQSAAMAIATRATVSAVASQLHVEPAAEGAGTGPSAIEELVGQVLDRLKPKLIAEIKRELKTPEEK